MSSSTPIKSPAVQLDAAVPILKVMRLQSPDLHKPTAGSLDTSCMIKTSMCLPDSFGSIQVGETFSAYLGALNVSRDSPVLKLTVTAQLQTPSQRWALRSSLDTGNSRGGVDVPPEGGLDTVVSHGLEEPGPHILRVEVGYGAPDGTTKTLRKFYRFNVTSPLVIQENTVRAGDSSCYVSILIENTSSAPHDGLTICSADFLPSEGLSATRIGTHTSAGLGNHGTQTEEFTSATKLFDGSGRLETGSSFRYLFLVKTESKAATMRGIAAEDELGRVVFTWRKAMGEAGRISSPPIVCAEAKPLLKTTDQSQIMMGTGSHFVVHQSGLSVDVATASASRSSNSRTEFNTVDLLMPVTVEPIEPPSKMTLAQPMAVQFLVVNHSDRPMNLQLQMRLKHMTGLAVCGPSFTNLGDVPASGGSTVATLRLIPLAAGLQRVQGCCVVDLATGLEVPQPPLFNVFVEKGVNQ